MTIIKINFSSDKGGVHHFESPDEAINWIRAERTLLDNTLSALSFEEMHPGLGEIHRAWRIVEDDVRKVEFDQSRPFLNVNASEDVFTSDSPAAEVLGNIAQSMSMAALKGALYAADILVREADWSSTDTIAGIQAYQVRMTRHRRNDKNPIPSELRGQIGEFNDQIINLRARIAAISTEISKTSAIATSGGDSTEKALLGLNTKVEAMSASLITQVRDAEVRVEATAAKNEAALADQRVQAESFVSETRQRLDDWIKAQTQAVRLTAPVTLWEERNSAHSAAATKLGRFAIAAGVVGTVATPFLSAFAFAQARTMLADAVPKAIIKNTALTPSGIRPTLHYELIFAGASTLFWLTMFFWLLRILVRRYATEQRLAVDASGRAAMTQTYLGLIMEHAAGEQERPIVLEALFRPVTENSKGEDGPPSTSIAAIIAALAAGKS